MWFKVGSVYVKYETTKVVDARVLAKEIDSLKEEVESLEAHRLAYPPQASGFIKEAIDEWNSQNIDVVQSLKLNQISEKIMLLRELENG